MYWYRETQARMAICRSSAKHTGVQVNDYRRIYWNTDAEELRVMALGVHGDSGRPLPIPAHLRHYCQAWASGSMPCGVFADWLSEQFEGQVPDAILALLREPCEDPEPVGVVK